MNKKIALKSLLALSFLGFTVSVMPEMIINYDPQAKLVFIPEVLDEARPHANCVFLQANLVNPIKEKINASLWLCPADVPLKLPDQFKGMVLEVGQAIAQAILLGQSR